MCGRPSRMRAMRQLKIIASLAVLACLLGRLITGCVTTSGRETTANALDGILAGNVDLLARLAASVGRLCAA